MKAASMKSDSEFQSIWAKVSNPKLLLYAPFGSSSDVVKPMLEAAENCGWSTEVVSSSDSSIALQAWPNILLLYITKSKVSAAAEVVK